MRDTRTDIGATEQRQTFASSVQSTEQTCVWQDPRLSFGKLAALRYSWTVCWCAGSRAPTGGYFQNNPSLRSGERFKNPADLPQIYVRLTTGDLLCCFSSVYAEAAVRTTSEHPTRSPAVVAVDLANGNIIRMRKAGKQIFQVFLY